MTSEELTAIVKGIVRAVRRRVQKTVDGLLTRLAVIEVQITQVAEVTKELPDVRERVAVLETRAPVPGPAGAPGRDGVDGVGFDDLIVEHDGERSFTFKCVRGDVVKVLGTFRIPAMIYRDVWAEGRTYEHGDVVTWARSMWHCKKHTTLKPDGVYREGPQAKDFWTLAVSRGRDAKGS